MQPRDGKLSAARSCALIWLLMTERAASRDGITRTAAYEVSPLTATGAAEAEHEVEQAHRRMPAAQGGVSLGFGLQ